ncbi:hypothetical protein [Sinomonas atrocyanea]|uniref:hypothetical protein n=1 Tax=Sinomonas atrocyanea TaxID=37927 RepID=UPI00278916BF|nr:hypothetical protein [Sinomonas atrocyanea]MDQ0258421.1 hypothetical protein [Sinomonas atrocyanea]MDR6620690.1 hypothetical protein [Sinomonas atrocyanea]
MSATSAPHHGHLRGFGSRSRVRSLARADQAYLMLRTLYVVAPILFGLDKFFNVLTYWPGYLAPAATAIVPLSAQTFMHIVGVVEIVAGLLVAWSPRWGSLVVALWLAGIIVNLLLLGHGFDVALRDFGLLVGALALSRLARRA